MERLWSKPFILLTIGMLFLYTGFYSLIPVMPLYIRQLGGNELDVGIIIGIYTLSAVICRPFVGTIVDKYGRRPFILYGIIGFAGIMAMYNSASGMLVLFILRFFHGASWAFSNSALGTAITDVIPNSRRGEGMGWYGISMTIAMAFGPFIGSFYIQNQSFHTMFWIASAISAVSLVLVLFAPMPVYKRRPIKQVTTDKPEWSLMAAILLMAVSFGGITTFLPLYAEAVHINSGSFFLIYAVSLTLIRPLAGKVTDRRGESFVIIPAFFFIIIALLNLSGAHSVVGIMISAVLYAIGFGSAQPALQSAALRLTSEESKGKANATFFTAFDLGIGLGSIMLGWISQAWGYSMMFVACAVSAFLSAVVFSIFIRRKLQH